VKASALALGGLEQSPEDLVEESRGLTDDEDADDDDDAQRDVVVLATATMSAGLKLIDVHLPRRDRQRPALDGVERGDETNVE